MTVEDKVAIVTGASKGIGKAIGIRLARDGFRVVVNYMSSQKQAEETADHIKSTGGMAMLYRADVSNSREVDAMTSFVMEHWGRIDLLVNNSGIMFDTPIEMMSDDEWNHVTSVNLTSVFCTCRAVIPHFKEQQYGRIINISSQAAVTGSANHAHYAAAKSGILGFTYSLAKEVGPYGITANVVSPGRIDTEMIATREHGRMQEWISQTPLRRIGKPEDVANAVAFLASDEADYITGLNLHVSGGLTMG